MRTIVYRIIILLILATSGLASLCSPAVAQVATLQADFLSRYQPAQNRLRDFYGKITMRANYFTHDAKTGNKVLQGELVFKSNASLLRLEGAWQDRQEKRPSETVTGVGSSYSFRLGKLPGRNDYFLKELTGSAKEITTIIWLNGKVFFAPFAFLDGTIEEIFLGDDFYVTNLTEERREGKHLVKVSWGRTKIPGWVGWFLFAPDDSWAVQEYAWWTQKNPALNHAVMEYSGREGEFPIIRKVHYWRDAEGGKRLREETYEVTHVIQGAVPESEFHLSAFGLPDPKGVKRPPPPRYWMWLAAATVGFAALALLFARLRRRAASKA